MPPASALLDGRGGDSAAAPDEKTLDQWLQNPTGDVHGSRMFLTVPNAADRQNAIAYLETLK
jgi:cytochrome c2